MIPSFQRLNEFAHDTPPRCFGSETEYTAALPYDTGSMPHLAAITPDRYVLADLRCPTEIITTNGGKLYVDEGQVLEYATPECVSPEQVALYEQAGEVIARETLKRISQEYATSSKVYKRSGMLEVVGQTGEILLESISAGHHENYSSDLGGVDITVDDAYDAQALKSILCTRGSWAGAGIVTPTGYATSQKDFFTNYDMMGKMSGDGLKTAWNTFAPHRLEIRSGDGNMSPWAIHHKYALTSLALRLIEHDIFPAHLYVASTVQAAENPDNVQLANGRTITALDHQKAIYDAAYDAFAAYDLPLYEEKAVYEFDRLYQDFQRCSTQDGDVAAVADRIDWAAKLEHLYDQGFAPADISSRNIDAVMHDLKWEDLSENGSARRWYRRVGQQAATASELALATTLPPQNTRAKARVHAIQHTPHRLATMSWDSLHLDIEPQVTIELGDAFDAKTYTISGQ